MARKKLQDENDDYKDDVISDDVDGMTDLFKELKHISKEILGKAPNIEMKEWYKQHQLRRKQEKQDAKDAEKAKKAMEKIQE